MSELEKLASSVRSLAEVTPKYIHAGDVIGRDLRVIRGLLSRSSHASVASGALESAIASLESYMAEVATFATLSKTFADQLAHGSSSASSIPGIALVGTHAALQSTDSNGLTTVTRTDPATGNKLTWWKDSSGRTTRAKARLFARSQEGRTAKESRTATAIGRLTRDTHFAGENQLGPDDGGHLIAALFGSHGAINISPQHFRINRSNYRSMEAKIDDLISKGYIVDFNVGVIYPDQASIRPSSFVVRFLATHPHQLPVPFQRTFANQDPKVPS